MLSLVATKTQLSQINVFFFNLSFHWNGYYAPSAIIFYWNCLSSPVDALMWSCPKLGLPGGSAGNKSACNVGDWV